MSSRALRRLRNDHPLLNAGRNIDDESSSEEEETDDEIVESRNQFCFSDSSSSEDETSSASASDEEVEVEDNEVEEKANVLARNESQKNQNLKSASRTNTDEEEYLDQILAQFSANDQANTADSYALMQSEQQTKNILLHGLDFRALDMDYNLRTILGNDHHIGVNHDAQGDQQNNRRGARGGHRGGRPMVGRRIGKKLLFGKARDNWIRPSSYVGGGMGMEVYGEGDNLPNPYADEAAEGPPSLWHKFVHADTYEVMESEFQRIANTGDVNMLAIFVAENPMCASALLQLAMVLAHTGNMDSGTELLRRCVFVYECASLPTFFGPLASESSDKYSSEYVRMDSDIEENKMFFSALFRLMQVSCMVG